MRTFAQKPKTTQLTETVKSPTPGRAHFGQSRGVSSILHLQRTIGNQDVVRLLQNKTEDLEEGSLTGASSRLTHDFSRIPVHSSGHSTIQPQLRVDAPEDAYEQEADRVADAVMRQPASTAEETARGKRPNDLDERGGKRSGPPLPAATRSAFERRLGGDFGAVRVHDSERAHAAATFCGANAFTVGNDITFARGRYAPSTMAGQRLLAHELVHVMQQRRGAGPMIQRDLATPPPAKAPPAQADLTEAEIATAIAFNTRRYTSPRIKLIQDLVGTEPTGTWAEEDIIALAQIQEEYGLKKDGKVGPETFQFLDRETSAEKLNRKDKNCLVALWVNVRPQTITALANGADIQGDFSMHAMLPSHCNCPDYEYRQFIRGHFQHERAGTVTDEADWFGRIPGGRLPAAFREDGDTSAATVNYGHRAQPREDANPKNRYENFDGTPNQADGCVYEGEDFPGGSYRGHNVVPTTGDTLDLLIQFRGEVQRRGRAVQTTHWTAVRGRSVLP
jgi:Domain of unknown function (DUF4157)